jgi:putative NIF3 family GTP cyclohydrolase 1 type 2
MKLREIYEAAVNVGMQWDPRGVPELKRLIREENKKFESMKEKEKKYFDREKLENPYADTRIMHDSGRNIKTVMIGIDIEVGEVLLADRLNEKGTKIDAIIAHHPEGRALASFYEVMGMQADIFSSFGVNISTAEALTAKREKEVGERVMAGNHYRAADAAKLLDISMMNMHTPADNCVATYLQKRFDKEKPAKLGDVIDMLLEEPEYSEYTKRGSGPVILVGSKERRVRKVMVDMTGGTEGSKDIYEKLSNAGVDTIVGMHFSGEHKKELEKNNMNVIIAGHIASDDVGVNILLDGIEKAAGKLNVIETSGFMRVKRK